MYKVPLSVLLSLFVYTTYSQQLFNKESEIILEFDQANKAYFEIKVATDNVFKTVSKLFKVDEASLRKINKLEAKKVDNRVIKVPIVFENIVRSKTELLARNGVYVPVFYFIKKGDTQYKLAKTYGKEEVETFMKRNQLAEQNLKINSKVNMGWFYIPNDQNTTKETPAKLVPLKNSESNYLKGTNVLKKNENDIHKISAKNIENKLKNQTTLASEVAKKATNKTTVNASLLKSEMTKDTVLSYANEEEIEKDSWINSKGIAYWQPSHRRSSGKYVLHSTAPINSIIKLYNPMMRRTVDAKVIGRIPKETYRKDVDVVISPAIAESLGALDSRFMVELTYKNKN